MNISKPRPWRVKDWAGSVFGFVAVLVTLVAVDDRVAHRFSVLLHGDPGEQVTAWSARVADLAEAVMWALRDQSIDHAPLLVFTAVGAGLVAFMVRT